MEQKLNYEYGNVGKYFVLYFDVQGVRDQIFTGIDKYSAQVTSEKQQDINCLSDALRSMLSAFVAMECFIKENPREYLDYIVKDDKRINTEQKKSLLKDINKVSMGVQQFSDSTLIYVRDTGNISQVLFEQCMARCAYELIKVMGKGIYVRGAMAYGAGWEVAPNCLFGPVLQEVYEIEQRIANTFRIVVTPHFYEFTRRKLADLERRGVNMNKSFPFKMISRDPDGVLIFDYLSDVSLENMLRFEKDSLTALKIIGENLAEAYNVIVKRHRELLSNVDEDQKKSRLILKYIMFMSYLEARLENFKKHNARFVKQKFGESK